MTTTSERRDYDANTGRKAQNDGFEGPNPHWGVDLAPRIAEIAGRQGGYITTGQLHEVGLASRAVDHRVSTGLFIRAYHGVYAVGYTPTAPRDQARGALLAAGPRTALAGRTALALWRNDRDWPGELELISARDVRIPGLLIVRSAKLLARDIRSVQGLRVTSPARTALDIAASVGAPQQAEDGDGQLLTGYELTRIVNELRHVNKLKVAQLRDVLARNPRHPGTKHLREIVGDAQREPTRSELENAFKRLIKRHKLPMPLINEHIGGERVDAYFPEHRLIVELDGREITHADDWRPAFEGDRARAVSVMAKTGIPTIRFTWDQITRLHHQTAAQLERILAQRIGAGTGAAAT